MKKVTWLGGTHEIVKCYSSNIRQEIGYNLDKVQRGSDPCDWKVMTSVGRGVKASKRDINLAKQRYSEMLELRRKGNEKS